MKNLPIGLQTFADLINGNFVYVDKTDIIYKLVRKKSVYFLARPRRFGKSLLISTMKAIFEGRRELFQDLAISKLDYDWAVRPVIHLSFSSIPHHTIEQFEESLCFVLRRKFEAYKLTPPPTNNSALLLTSLVEMLHAQLGPVVILVDEYDKPIIDHLDDPALAEATRVALRGFYQVFKDLDQYLHFIFITGVSKFTQTSIFSGLNNLFDLTTTQQAATLCGYTKQEIEQNFVPHLEDFANKLSEKVTQTMGTLEEWYDGYSFEWGCEKCLIHFRYFMRCRIKS